MNDSSIENFDFISKTDDGSQKLEFNDTLEEIEFIMTKGKDYIKNVVEKVSFSTRNEVDKENMFKSKLPTPTSAKVKDKLQVPFKKPLSSVSSLKKIDFNHIRSPIGEYIKNTARSPMILSAKPDTNTKQQTKLAFENSDSSRRYPSTIGIKNLPKKAYFSSEIKKVNNEVFEFKLKTLNNVYFQYTDERPAVVIPGGPKIQNHLKSNRLMGVVKHEGKIRMSPKSRDVSPMQTSFSNLSVAAGDVSFYTLKK